MMARKPSAPAIASDDDVRALLKRYNCPVPFHEVRTRFLGNIATPAAAAHPMEMVKSLWGGELPPFDSLDALNELLGVLVMGLWNRLSKHQERSAPFRLTRIDAPATREGLAALALMRRQELDGFIAGLFGENESIDLPERAHHGLGVLGQMRAMFAGVVDVATDASKPATSKDIGGTLGHMREMTRIAEHEIHAIILSCTRARRQFLASLPATKPTLH
jgi:hypothetical protein